MKVALGVFVLFLVLGSAVVMTSQVPQQTSAIDGKQYMLLPYVFNSPRQSYEKVCGPFYWSNVLGQGSELVGFRFTRDAKVESVAVYARNLSVMVDEATASPTAQEVSEDNGGHFVLRVNAKDYAGYGECLAQVEKMK